MPSEAPFKKLKLIYEDIDRLVVEGDELIEETIDAKTQKAIIAQVNEEYDLSFKDTEAKRATWLSRLQLFNNQRRDTSAVGDPLMFTIFMTVIAALYDDKLMVSFQGREEGDQDVEENLNALAEYDYDLMGMDEINYDWIWDTAFFGRGLLLMNDFDRSKGYMAPVPEVIDPTTWIRDSRASSVNGKGAMRFGGYETGATYHELKKLPGYFNLASLKKGDEINSLLKKTREERSSAQGRQDSTRTEESLGKYNNYEFNILNWFTTIKGERYSVGLGNSRSTLVRLVPLKFGKLWPIIDRTLYPMAHDWDGVSIPDVTEDKQRARAVFLNLGMAAAKADVLVRFLFDRTRIKNKNDLNLKQNKYIPVDGPVNDAIAPVQKSGSYQYANAIMDALDQAAQRATATPEIQMGVPADQQRTLGELNLVSSKTDTRYSMSAKIFGWSEKALWRQWYRGYKTYFKDGIDEKIIRIQGVLGPEWRPLAKENIISNVDPDVKVESRVVSEAKRMRELQSFDSWAAMAMQEPTSNRRYIIKKGAKLRGLKKEEIDMALPPTIDELQAEDENKLLNAGKLPPVKVEDDHLVHIYVHSKADQNAQTMAHIWGHKRAMITKRDTPELYPPPAAPGIEMPGAPKIPQTPSAMATQ